MAITMDGIFVNGQKATFHPEDILSGDASAYTQEIGTAVEEWLEENVTGGEQVTDTTLTLPGVPADAKKTGDEIDELKEEFSWLNNGRLIFNPSYILTDVIYATDSTIRPLSGCICYVYELEQIPYHIEVANRDNVVYGLSNTLYSGTSIKADVIVNESVTEYDFDNNLNYKYLYITKKGQSSEYGITLSANFKDKILGNEMRVIDVADEHVGILANKLSSYSRGYIISTTGAFYEWLSDNFYSTDYLDVEDVSKLILLMPVLTSSTTHAGAAFYDSEKVYISGIECSVSSAGGNETRIINVPPNAKYIRTTCRGSAWSDFFVKYDDIYINALNIKKIKDKASTFGVQMFAKIGVIGDSISCGWAKDKNGNNSRRNTEISWPQQMARRLGCTAYNLGASGVDPVEWFQSDYEFAEYCYTQYQSVGFCDLYIIGLGLNPTSTLGSISDINSSDYTQNGESFFGQYARIIQMINAEHPNAIVICVTEPTTRIASTDQAVRDICALSYINANLLDLEKDYFDLFNTEEIISERQPDGLHYTPYGYSLLADAMETALNDYIAKHTTSFKYVGVASV